MFSMNGQLSSDKNSDDQVLPGKIAVITDHSSINEDDYHSTDRLAAKYGGDKIIHVTWPKDFMPRQDKVIDIVTELAADREIRALIFNQAVPGTSIAVSKLKKSRDDIFTIYCSPHELAPESASQANLLLRPNETDMGRAMVKQAIKQGAKVFVHYSFPRHMAIAALASRHEIIRDTCAAEGIRFVDSVALDPTEEAGFSRAQQFIQEDVPKLVAQYGEDTAFFITNCHLQISLIKAVVDNHAIFPQPCCPSPYHGFPEALGIKSDKCLADLHY